MFQGQSSIVAPVDPEGLGRAFAMADAEDQAAMLNKAGELLYMACKGQQGTEKQLCAIAEFMNNAGWHMVKELAGFYEFRKEILQKP